MAAPGPGSLVEREAELAALREAAERSAQGDGRLVVIEGPAGIGKTRLLRSACELAKEGGHVRAFTARGTEFEAHIAFGVARQLLDPFVLGLEERERAEPYTRPGSWARMGSNLGRLPRSRASDCRCEEPKVPGTARPGTHRTSSAIRGCGMRRIAVAVVVGVLCVVMVVIAAVASATHSAERHENMRLVANYSDGGTYRNGTDMAFWGTTALLGRLDQSSPAGPGGFRIMNIADPTQPREVGEFTCPGDQSDLSVWKDLVVVSVDKPTEPGCQPPTSTSTWEGIRLVSIAEPNQPSVLAEIRTDCGSHTNTVYPDPANGKLYVYVLSYPLAGRYNPAQSLPTCNAAGHHKISIVEVDLSNPGATGADDVTTVDVGPSTIGCHDVTFFLERRLAAAACLTESQIWDISDPANPRIIGKIADPRINIHHSTTFSNDGSTLVVGDELGGAAASPGCLSDEDTYGGLFFYDVAGDKAAAPELVGTYKLPQQVASEFCTAHLFNVVPRKDDRDVLVSSWYAGATSVIDFTDAHNPRQIAYYIPSETTSPDEQPTEAAAWASYWYNGYVYSNNFDEDVNSISKRSRGLDVFKIDLPSVNKGAVKLPRLNPQVQEPFRR